MGLVLRALGDPTPHLFLFLKAEGKVRLRRRHYFIRIGRENLLANQAFLGFTGNNGMLVGFFPFGVGFFGKIETKAGFATGLIRAMAFETAIGQNRPDIPVELQLIGRR